MKKLSKAVSIFLVIVDEKLFEFQIDFNLNEVTLTTCFVAAVSVNCSDQWESVLISVDQSEFLKPILRHLYWPGTDQARFTAQWPLRSGKFRSVQHKFCVFSEVNITRYTRVLTCPKVENLFLIKVNFNWQHFFHGGRL